MINFCPPFFDFANLQDGMESGMGSPSLRAIQCYDNRARVFFHELAHLDFAADSSENNAPKPRIYDLSVTHRTAPRKESVLRRAHGAYGTKVLACWPNDPNKGGPAGRLVQRNADNLAWSALGKYAKMYTNDHYPKWPVVTFNLDPALVLDQHELTTEYTADLAAVMQFATNADGLFLSSTDTLTDLKDDEAASPDGPEPLNLTGFASLADYPSGYTGQVLEWLEWMGHSSTYYERSVPAPTVMAGKL